ncbi:MAG TPA: hypothetical protein VNM72_02260 [Blastocatellia bacterium]|nr:hypothetical protein [Blastocatellia bacterium]
MQFVVIAHHTPNLCPTSNAKIRGLLKESAKEIPHLAQRLGITIISLNVCGPEHQVLAVIESPDVERVHQFIMGARLVQWNTINVHATWSLEETLARADALPPIF